MKTYKGMAVLLIAFAVAVSCFTAAIAVAQTAEDGDTMQTIAVGQSRSASDMNFTETEYRNQFLLSGWRLYYDYEFKSFEEQTKDMVDAGLNWMMWTYPWEDKNGNSNPSPETLDEWKHIDEVYGTFGLKYMLKYGYSGSASRVSKYIEWLPELDNCEFLYVEDEPNYQHFGYSSEFVQTLVKAYPSVASMVNLLPSYGVSGSYRDYVQTWVNTVGRENLEYLSFDFYPFRPTGEYEINYFSDLETMRKVAYDNGKIKTLGYIQSGSWAGTRRPNPTEMRWNMNSMLAYGFKGMNHFCWVSPYPGAEYMNNDFPISRTGEKSEYYDDIADLNWAARAMGNVLMNYDCLGAYHTGVGSPGAQLLPENFVFMPSGKSELVISYMESKDDGEDMIAVFNKSLRNDCTERLLINSLANVEGVERFVHCSPRTVDYDFDALDISEGYIDVTLAPGEVALYKLVGDNVIIPGSLTVPNISAESGMYTGDITVSLDVPKGINVYYTDDGSYPTDKSTRYDGEIVIKAEDKARNHKLRFIAYQGPSYSKVEDREYIVMPGNVNKALTAALATDKTFYPYRREGDASTRLLTDGRYDKAIATRIGEFAYVTLDLGESVTLQKAVIDVYGGNAPDILAVDVSNSPTFADFDTMYRLDDGNMLGQGGTEGECVATADGRSEISAERLAGKAYRYVRVYDRYDNRTVFSEIEIYHKTGESAPPTVFDDASWDKQGKNWTLSGDVAQKTDGLSASEDEKQGVLIYKTREHTDCVISADFMLADIGESNYGAIGFEVGVNKSGERLLVGVRADGSGVVFAGEKQYSAKSSVAALEENEYYNVCAVAVGSQVRVYVNGVSAIAVADEDLTVERGTLGIWGSVLPVSVGRFSVTEMQYDECITERNIESYEPIDEPIAVEPYTDAAAAIDRLPSQITVYDNYGDATTVDVIWDMSGYDGTVSGYCAITGKAANLPAGLVNRNNVVVSLNLFVRYGINEFELKQLIASAKALTASNYTAETYAALSDAVSTAEELLGRATATQNDYGVSVMNIDNAMQKLTYSLSAKSEVDKLVALYADRSLDGYFDNAVKERFVGLLAEWDALIEQKADVKTLTSKSQQLTSVQNLLVTCEQMQTLRAKIDSINADGASQRAKSALAAARAVAYDKYASRTVLLEAEKLLDAYFE